MRHVMICTPMYGGLCTSHYLTSLLSLYGEAARRGVQLLYFSVVNESLITRARARCVHEFLKTDCTHLLFIDADLGFNPRDVFALLDADRDVIGGIYPQKAILWNRVRAAVEAGKVDDGTLRRAGAKMVCNFANDGRNIEVEDGVAEVEDVGTGFMLIKRRVLKMMRELLPDLHFTLHGGGADDGELSSALFDTMIEPGTGRYLSEDYAFCRRWQQLGGKVHAYLPAQFKHVGNYVYEGAIEDAIVEVA